MRAVRPFAWVFTALLLTAASAAAQTTTVILVRHAEKEAAPENDPPLTDAGRARAEAIRELLKDAGISVIYSTPTARTVQTAQPLATAIGVQITETPIRGGLQAYLNALAAKIRSENRGQTVLVVGHSNTVPQTVAALGAPAVPEIADPEYDGLYIVTIPAEGPARVIRAKQN